MKIYNGNQIRNVAVLGHSGSGKTSILEAALNVAGVTNRIGKVEEGNTVSDYDQEEIKRKVSISSSVIPIEWKENKINFIDTPGYFDFVGEVKQALSVADLCLIVVNGKSGLEVGTEKVWEYCTELGVPKFIFVNDMDDEQADLLKVVEQLKGKFGKSLAPLQVPYYENGKFVGFVNAIKKEGRKYVNGRTEACEVPAGLEGEVEEARAMISEAVAETSEENLEKFFNEEPFTVEEMQAGVKKGLTDGSLTPIICGSATLNIGIRVLLNSLIAFVPPANEYCKEVTAKSVKDKSDVKVKCDDNEPFSAFVFKTIADPYVGRLNLFRVYSGVMKRDSSVYNPRTDSIEKIAHIYLVRGKEQIEVDELHSGDIGALSKMANVLTGDTLCTKNAPILLKEIDYPNSYLTFAVYPKNKGEEDKLSGAFAKMLEEDKTLRFEVNKETKESLVYGVGDNQIDVMMSKLKNKYKLDVELRDPKIPYKEMIKGKVKVQGKYKKQSGGHGQYGDVHIEFEPSGDFNKQYIFEEKIFGGSVPRNYFPAVEKGIQESVKFGPLAGCPVVGIKCTLVDGSYHPVDSSEMAFKMATIMAFKDGFLKSKPTILEPICKVAVKTPDDYTGDIMGDLNKKRGRILGMGKEGAYQVIEAEVPQAEMFKYSTELRSMTQGRASFTMNFERYEEATNDVQQKVIENYKKEKEQDK
ncbi:MAG: elongation factor G [Clostridiales bacterium]|jgi:elongation factor G|nr:elongation factor G [Clostridiales bacterium]